MFVKVVVKSVNYVFVFEEVFEFSVQETLRGLSQNGKLIVLNGRKKLPLETSPWTGCPCNPFIKYP